jgi:uncharacterized protein (DUF2147 family)
MRVIKAMMSILFLSLSGAAFGQSIMGDWLTDDRSAIIRVAPCGERLCGTILHVLDPAAPPNDAHNPDPARKRRPLVGVAVLDGFQKSAAGWDGGTAYDPKAGKSYRSRLALAGPDGLDVTGCVMFLCRTKHWTRAEVTPRR